MLRFDISIDLFWYVYLMLIDSNHLNRVSTAKQNSKFSGNEKQIINWKMKSINERIQIFRSSSGWLKIDAQSN